MLSRTVHFLPDSPYSNWYVTNCENTGLSSSSEFYCIGDDSQFINRKNIQLVSANSNELNQIIVEINADKYHKIIINYLSLTHANVINSIINSKVLVFWIAWSDDLYTLPKLSFKKYDNYSMAYSKFNEKLLKKNDKSKYTLKQRIGRLKMIYIDGIDLDGKNNWQKIYKAIERINYFATGVEEEKKIIEKELNRNIKWFPFAYVSATNGIDITNSLDVKKELILVGNSADPANNQYEVMVKLDNLKVDDKILLPLSYGDIEYTKKLISDIAKFISSEKLIVLKDFMEKTEYYNMLKQVKAAIFAHNIQQAFGNIAALICFGSKIFLKKENYLFKQLKIWGIQVFSIEDEFTFENVTVAFDKETMLLNRKIIFELFSQEKVDQYYTGLLKI